MLSHKTLNQPLSSPRHSDSEAPPARPRAVRDDEKSQEQARPANPAPARRRRFKKYAAAAAAADRVSFTGPDPKARPPVGFLGRERRRR